jgi:hypothetical protein
MRFLLPRAYKMRIAPGASPLASPPRTLRMRANAPRHRLARVTGSPARAHVRSIRPRLSRRPCCRREGFWRRLDRRARRPHHGARLIVSGLVDAHMHTSSYAGWAGIETAARAAGGIAAIEHARTRPLRAETETETEPEIFEIGPATGETCIRCLCTTEDDLAHLGGCGTCHPPWRSAAEIERRWQSLRDERGRTVRDGAGVRARPGPGGSCRGRRADRAGPMHDLVRSASVSCRHAGLNWRCVGKSRWYSQGSPPCRSVAFPSTTRRPPTQRRV